MTNQLDQFEVTVPNFHAEHSITLTGADLFEMTKAMDYWISIESQHLTDEVCQEYGWQGKWLGHEHAEVMDSMNRPKLVRLIESYEKFRWGRDDALNDYWLQQYDERVACAIQTKMEDAGYRLAWFMGLWLQPEIPEKPWYNPRTDSNIRTTAQAWGKLKRRYMDITAGPFASDATRDETAAYLYDLEERLFALVDPNGDEDG